MKTGKLIISLDFELYWGILDHVPLQDKRLYFDNTRKAIPKILKLFEDYDIQATWATVGFLFFENLDELLQNMPEKIPHYSHPVLSTYNYIHKNQDEIKKYPEYFFAPGLIKQIVNTKGQEVATHTFSHYYCLEKGQTKEDFKSDIEAHRSIADKMGISLKSLVFPRNQYNKEYLDICMELGLKVIRVNPKKWFWNMERKETLFKKIIRTADAYLPLNDFSFDENDIYKYKKQLVLLPASRFFRPISGLSILNKLRINRIKKEMSLAAKKNKVYHLWWHPHNFGNQPELALSELENILSHYKKLNKKYHFISIKMSDL